jgi:hypothetical protein
MRNYEIQNTNGETFIVQLDDDEAKARGLSPASESGAKSRIPANKARSASNKSKG